MKISAIALTITIFSINLYSFNSADSAQWKFLIGKTVANSKVVDYEIWDIKYFYVDAKKNKIVDFCLVRVPLTKKQDSTFEMGSFEVKNCNSMDIENKKCEISADKNFLQVEFKHEDKLGVVIDFEKDKTIYNVTGLSTDPADSKKETVFTLDKSKKNSILHYSNYFTNR